MPMPRQQPGRSKQNYQTPSEFIAAVQRRWQLTHFLVDLAANAENTQATDYFTEEDDSLSKDWKTLGRMCHPGTALWLNPPFSRIEPWVEKALKECSGQRLLMLLPAAVGANWFRDYVWTANGPLVIALNGRLKFVGCEDYYPKDCMILDYGHEFPPSYMDGGEEHFEVWDWRK